jgi:hypothetical protein
MFQYLPLPAVKEILESISNMSLCIVMKDDGVCWQQVLSDDYDIFAKMQEPLKGTCYNTRVEIIHAVWRSPLDIKTSGCVGYVKRLPQIRQKVVHVEGRLY